MKETNMEHFRSEITDVLNEWDDFGRVNGKLAKCYGATCNKCEFSRFNNDLNQACSNAKIKWLMSEYKPEPVLTAREKHFVEFAQEGWLARNSSNKLIFHKAKPTKREYMWISFRNSCTLGANLFGDMFPFITWEDEEPWSIEELRKVKCENETDRC